MATSFAIIKTSQRTTPEAIAYSGGPLRPMTIVFSAILVRHGDDSLLFDSGLGCEVDAQYAVDMPLWKKPLFSYGPVDPVIRQLERAGIPMPSRIVLSHGHWDHASGLVDFPGAEVWITAQELAFVQRAVPRLSIERGVTMPTQFRAPIRWHEFEFEDRAFENFAQSLDLYGDGAVVLVPLHGHTPGSIGMFVTVDSGKRTFFCGDTVWNARAIADARPKMFLARMMVDCDHAETQTSIAKLRELAMSEPDITIVPAHDGAVQRAIGYFPTFAT
jgi:glyoxylase-like metal-dependent hydrolase (beta-lactamase superfamily II)